MPESAQTAQSLSQGLAREIARFLHSTIRRSNSDLYYNRRTEMRYHRSWPMFVARLDVKQPQDVSVTLYDISREGVGFYCDDGFPIGTPIAVKLFWSDPTSPRVPAVVQHNKITLEGTLVGAQFVLNDTQMCKLADLSKPGWYG
jgi:hypothetical protein